MPSDSSSGHPPAPMTAPAGAAQIAEARRIGVLLLVNLAFVAAFGAFAKRIQAVDGPTVIDLELAFRAGAFRQILALWVQEHANAIALFRTSLWALDILFPFVYALFLSRLYVWVVETGGGTPLRIGRAAPWIAAALD